MNRRFEVKSRTNENLHYIVQEIRNKLECNCPAGMRDMKCNHKDIISKFLSRLSITSKDLERINEL